MELQSIHLIFSTTKKKKKIRTKENPPALGDSKQGKFNKYSV